MLYYRTNTGNKTVVPFLIASKLFLPTNLTLNNPAKDTSLLEFCFTLLIHICTICKNAVMFILNKIKLPILSTKNPLHPSSQTGGYLHEPPPAVVKKLFIAATKIALSSNCTFSASEPVL